MNWGKGLIGGMFLFMLFILSMCFYMFRAPDDDYDHQYYEKGLTYNRYYNKEMQVIKDQAQPVIKIAGECVFIKFKDAAAGTLRLQRPSNVLLDRRYRFDTHQSSGMQFSAATIAKGRWQLILDWRSNNKSYAYQTEMMIP